MIARKHRFHGYGSLRHTYQHGKTLRGSYGTLKYARNNRRDGYRVAVVVSKKVNKSAVVRNRIRRRIYEIVRQNIVAEEPYDLIFTAFNEVLATVPAEELQERVVSKLRAAHIALKPKSTSRPGRHDIVENKEIN